MNQPLVISENVQASLKATRPWIKFMAIMWTVSIAFLLIFGLAKLAGLITNTSETGELALFSRIMGAFYVAIGLAYVMPALYLFRYAKAIAGMQGTSVVASFEDALKQQKSYWKYYGIFLIVVIVVGMLVGGGVMFVSLYMAAHHQH